MNRYLNLISNISKDRMSGGRALGQKALSLIKMLSRDAEAGIIKYDEVKEYLKLLKNSRSLMGIVYNIADFSLRAIRDTRDWVSRLKGISKNIESILNDSQINILKFSRNIYAESITTLSFSNNVLKILEFNRKYIRRINLLESRPGTEIKNAYLTFKKLGFDVYIYPDSNIYHALNNSGLIIIGFDSITLKDGYIIHKSGTYPLLATSKSIGINSVAVGESLKIIEEYTKNLVMERWKYRVEMLDIDVASYPFDYTPIKLLDTLITDQALINSPKERDLLGQYLQLTLKIFD